MTKLGPRACRWAGVARESQCPLSDGPPEPRDGLDGPLEPRGPGRRRLGCTSRRGVRKDSESLKPAAAPFCVQLLGRTEAPPFGPSKGSPEAERHLQKDGTPRCLRGSSPPQGPFVAVCSQGHLKRTNGARRCLHGRRKLLARQAMVRAESFSGRAASPRGRRWTGLGDALLSLPDHPGARRSPTPSPRPGGDFCTAARRRGWPGEPGRVTGGCLSRSPLPRGTCALGEGGSQAEAAFSPCAWAPGLLPAPVPLSRVSGGHVGPASPAGARPLRRHSPRDTASPG